jgi:polysaccharide export outer membrane protein
MTDEQNQVDGNYQVIDLSAQTLAPYMRAREQALTTAVTQPTVPEIRLIPGDVVTVSISDSANASPLFAPLATGGTQFPNLRLNERGQIKLPYAGTINAKGMSPESLATAIQRQLGDVATDPQVMVHLTGDLSGSVLVAGAVAKPGRFSALQGPLTLLDAINLAGGPILEPHLVKVIVRNGKTSQSLSYEDVLAGDNLTLAPRSEVILERARKRFVAMGAVGKPGLMDLPSNNPSLLEVLGTAGWIKDSSADPSGVFVFRLEQEPGKAELTAKVFRLDLSNPAAVFLARQFLVQPEDAVYVTNAAVYEWQKIISPILQVLILGNTVTNASFY